MVTTHKKRFRKVVEWEYEDDKGNIMSEVGFIGILIGLMFISFVLFVKMRLNTYKLADCTFILFGMSILIIGLLCLLTPIRRKIYYEEIE